MLRTNSLLSSLVVTTLWIAGCLNSDFEFNIMSASLLDILTPSRVCLSSAFGVVEWTWNSKILGSNFFSG